jgi:hypothetical protein
MIHEIVHHRDHPLKHRQKKHNFHLKNNIFRIKPYYRHSTKLHYLILDRHNISVLIELEIKKNLGQNLR